jgi:hypothetical protein
MLHRDKYGIIGQIQPDGSIEGGDSATWNGAYVYLTNSDFPYVKTFEVSWGGYVRHPHPEQTYNGFGAYYANPWSGCMSRDQWTGVIGALIRQKERMALLRLIAHHALKGFLFTYNTIPNGQDPTKTKFNLLKFFYRKKGENYFKLPDITLFNMWGMYLRGFGAFSWIFWPLLCVLDLHLLIDTVFSNKQDDNDQINYALRMMVAREFVPTPTVALAVKILDKQHLLDMLKGYWCGWRNNCDMYPLYEKKITELLK